MFLPGFVGGPPPIPLTYPLINNSTTTTTSSTSSSHVANLPSGIIAGEILVVVCNTGSFATTASTGWNVVTSLSVQVFWRVADGSEGSTMTITGMTTPQKTCSVAMRIGGQSGNTPTMPTNTVNGGYTSGVAANPNCQNLNIAFGNTKALLITYGNWNVNGTPVTPSGFPSGYTALTNVVTSGSGTNQRMYVMWRQAQVAAEDPSAWTAASSGYTTGVMAIQGAP